MSLIVEDINADGYVDIVSNYNGTQDTLFGIRYGTVMGYNANPVIYTFPYYPPSGNIWGALLSPLQT